ncbi:MAG: single-stranded-DNA-specific exonuclease RecJ [Planctomycetota bacterium]|nr:single-stranded-DNA-specific exonuclease RecJ [Planctomycetota bacterium]
MATVQRTDLVKRLLVQRGLLDESARAAFMNPRLGDLHLPETLPGAEAAAVRLVEAVRAGRRIAIYGDYDVDGVMSTAILHQILTLVDPDQPPMWYVPHRVEEGYGLHVPAIDELAARGAEVLVTVDCGITALEPARRAAELGLELIITDHHRPATTEEGNVLLPEASVIVHPDLPGRSAPFTDLCGAGVAFKLAWAFLERWFSSRPLPKIGRELLLDLLPSTAIATIADVVPLHGENRIIAAHGLKLLASTRHGGLRSLLESSGLGKGSSSIQATDVAFRLAPMLNAAGRMAHAREAVELMITPDEDRATEVVRQLARLNRQRQSACKEITEHASLLAEERGFLEPEQRVIVLAHESWNPGLIGICCSRLVERFGRPVVLMQESDGICRGSARSIPSYSIHEAFTQCARTLNRTEEVMSFGGHAVAAGLTIARSGLEEFTEHLGVHAAGLIAEADLVSTIEADGSAELCEFPLEVVRRLEQLDPFGAGNPYPRFVLERVRVSRPEKMGRNGEHLRLNLSADGGSIGAVWWRPPEILEQLRVVERDRVPMDVLAEPQVNRGYGPDRVQMRILDVRESDSSRL